MTICAPGHLHPSAAALVDQDDAIRIEAIRQKRWIAHAPACRVLDVLEHLFAQPRGDRMEGLLLTGGSGMGKTMVLKRFARAHRGFAN